MSSVVAEFPEKLAPLFEKHKYKSIRGGRGSGKSWGVARALLILGTANVERVLCSREYQNAIAESVHKLLADQIEALGLSGFYDVQKTTIIGANGTTFTFAGLHHNINSIKSMEGITKAWVEEAQVVSKTSWDILIPTVFRRETSEIWLTWNPHLAEDETYRRFVKFPPPGTADIQINWSDNAWFSAGMREEKDHLEATDYSAWLNVWQGECRNQVDNPLWTKETIDGCRFPIWTNEDERTALINSLQRIVVAVDPSGCSGADDKRSDEIGIVVAGIGHDGIGRVLADLSGKYSPDGWGRVVAKAYVDWKADKVVAEKNFGGAMVESTLRAANGNLPVRMVDASKGKAQRAEPVAALYEQGRIKHVGYFPELERQMLQFSASGYKGAKSPDRCDAAIWGLSELMVAESTTGILEYYRELRDKALSQN